MRDETSTWLRYAEENLAVTRMSLERGLLNACLQNAQQCVEKVLKALVVEHGLAVKRTHSVQELAGQLRRPGWTAGSPRTSATCSTPSICPRSAPWQG